MPNVLALPKDLPAPQPDYKNYDHARELEREQKHQADLKAWLIANGWDGPNTGRIYSEHIADGYAVYMVAEGKKKASGFKFVLIHLPYGDGYQSRNVHWIPPKEIVERLDAADRMREVFQTARTAR